MIKQYIGLLALSIVGILINGVAIAANLMRAIWWHKLIDYVFAVGSIISLGYIIFLTVNIVIRMRQLNAENKAIEAEQNKAGGKDNE